MSCDDSKIDSESDEKKCDSDPNTNINIHEKYRFHRTLASGSSCHVIEAMDMKEPSIKVAIKTMPKKESTCKRLYNEEVKILKQLDHKNIVKFMDNAEDETHFYILTSLCEGGELFDRIVHPNPKQPMTEKRASSLIHDMLVALQFCHQKNIVHRDLKPANFVFETKDINANIILIDFGCATVVDKENRKRYKDLVGTSYYISPEVILQSDRIPLTGRILKSSDIWSIGIIAFAIMTGRPPFNGHTNKEIFKNITCNKLIFPKNIKLSNGFKDFVSKTLIKNPYKRITLDNALRHPWIQGKDANDIELNKDVITYLRQFHYQSKFKKAITQCLASNMSKEPTKEVRKHFERLDKDGNNKLDVNELSILLLDLGVSPPQAKIEAKKMLEQADTDKNGFVEFDEFKAIWHRKLLTQHEQYVHRVFEIFDENGDGEIDIYELHNVLGDDFSSIVDMIKEVDVDGNGKISFDEFKEAMQEHIDKGNVTG